jgi:hypothetical protein
MQKRKQKKLTLNLETLRQLEPKEVRPAAGGCFINSPTTPPTAFCTKLLHCS